MRRTLALSAAVALLAGQAAVAKDLARIQRGDGLFQYWCAACHGSGPGHPGTDALRKAYNGNPPALLEQRTDLTAEAVARFLRTGTSIMPFFRKTELSDIDVADIGAYLSRNTPGQ